MLARIFQPARNAMQSGQAGTRHWLLEFVPSDAKVLDPLMGWTGSGDMNRQVRLRFETAEEAIAYAEAKGIPFQRFDPKPRKPIVRAQGYGDNFAAQRRIPWSH